AQFGLDARRLAASTDAIAAAVQDGPCTRSELGARLGSRGVRVGPAELAAMVMHAELHMAVCSGPMRGRQHTYVAFDHRAQGEGPMGEEALELLARRYFSTRGPATVQDFAWWAGLPMADARRGLDLAADYLEFHEQGGRRYAFAPPAGRAVEPAIDFVQCYDEAVVAYRHSRDILKTPQVSFEPLRPVDGFVHLILRHGQLLGYWRVARATSSIEIRLADVLSPVEQNLLAPRLEALRHFLNG
ncbi:MAG: winged helix DNA-binding domain-containing protein, partial [Acidimicrobiaceae bacterium]|nr:winged helix DNA-binding domain-containing protein [Acidimicrobiaceae bacterium]